MFMKLIGALLIAIVVESVSMSQARADSLIVKYNNGKEQVMELKSGIKNIVEVRLVRGKGGAEQISEKKVEKNKNAISKKEHVKRSDRNGAVNLGNEIKVEWKAPNPYLPPTNE